jgi:hypothetical protein
MRRVFINKCFLFTAGTVCCLKWFITGSRNALKDIRKSQMIPCQMLKWLWQQPKDFYTAGLDALAEQVYQCRWRICREMNVFSVSKMTWFTFYINL